MWKPLKFIELFYAKKLAKKKNVAWFVQVRTLGYKFGRMLDFLINFFLSIWYLMETVLFLIKFVLHSTN